MKPYVQDTDFTLYCGDVREVLAGLPDESVQCVVTSPPYWGLRDYGTGLWEGGDEGCDHVEGRRGGGIANSTLQSNKKSPEKSAKTIAVHDKEWEYRETCGKCGARRVDQQLGLEPIPELYVENMVAVFREVRRVLRRDGTCWLNIGDSYAGSWSGNSMRPDGGEQRAGGPGFQPLDDRVPARSGVVPAGLKPKDLCGIPWRLAFALQADGWYLRSEIIWAKPNPMPESVTDRPTKSHEQVFLLTRSPRYFYDADAVREAFAPASEARYAYAFGGKKSEDLRRQDAEGPGGNRTAVVGKRTFPGMPAEAERGPDGRRQTHVEAGEGSLQHRDGERWPNAGRNMRSVWEIPTQPFAEAHFATYPQALVERCIKAGTALGDVVFDPFLGSGTTALVARRLGRRSIGSELSPEYAEMAARRLQQLSLLAEPAA